MRTSDFKRALPLKLFARFSLWISVALDGASYYLAKLVNITLPSTFLANGKVSSGKVVASWSI